MTEIHETQEKRGVGCGVSGCLFGAVALFVLLLIAMLVIAFFRFSSPPEPRFGARHAQPTQALSLSASTQAHG